MDAILTTTGLRMLGEFEEYDGDEPARFLSESDLEALFDQEPSDDDALVAAYWAKVEAEADKGYPDDCPF